jgi:hypothetical protein
MSSGFWKRASASLIAGALTAFLASPLTTLAASPPVPASLLPATPGAEQLAGLGQCVALGGGGLTGAGVQSIGLSQIYPFGAGGFYGPHYDPVYSSYGLGTASGFLNYSGGQPSRLATLAGSPLCQGAGLTVPAPTGGAFVVRDWGTTPSSVLGFVGAGRGAFGASPFGTGAFGTGAFGTTGLGAFGTAGLGGFGTPGVGGGFFGPFGLGSLGAGGLGTFGLGGLGTLGAGGFGFGTTGFGVVR